MVLKLALARKRGRWTRVPPSWTIQTLEWMVSCTGEGTDDAKNISVRQVEYATRIGRMCFLGSAANIAVSR